MLEIMILSVFISKLVSGDQVCKNGYSTCVNKIIPIQCGAGMEDSFHDSFDDAAAMHAPVIF